jgi:hypothetical protein
MLRLLTAYGKKFVIWFVEMQNIDHPLFVRDGVDLEAPFNIFRDHDLLELDQEFGTCSFMEQSYVRCEGVVQNRVVFLIGQASHVLSCYAFTLKGGHIIFFLDENPIKSFFASDPCIELLYRGLVDEIP